MHACGKRMVFIVVCLCVWAIPHPWMASSAWSAMSACPPQPPCLPLSSWKQVCLDAEVCLSMSHAMTTRTCTHSPLPSFLLSSSSPFCQWLLSPETLSFTLPFMLSHYVFLQSSSFLSHSLPISLCLFFPHTPPLCDSPPSPFFVFSSRLIPCLLLSLFFHHSLYIHHLSNCTNSWSKPSVNQGETGTTLNHLSINYHACEESGRPQQHTCLVIFPELHYFLWWSRIRRANMWMKNFSFRQLVLQNKDIFH